MHSQIFILITGLLGLYLGAEALVKGGSRLALALGMKPILIGLTVVAFGTSLPELSVAMISSVGGENGISLGNVIGSNICNILLIFGVMAVIRPIKIEEENLSKDIPAVLAAGAMLWILSADGMITRFDGALLLFGLAIYLKVLWSERKTRFASEITGDVVTAGAMSYILIPIGLGLLIFGGWACVHSGTAIAAHLGIPEYVVGLTVIAIGTVLPELAIGVVSSVRNQGDLPVGNALGSFIFNALGVIGLAAVIQPYSVGADINSFSLPVMMAAAIAFLPIAIIGKKVSRIEGVGFLIAYVVYVIAVF
ncbi:MAG: calcium/sodium antiporter [bacterium]